VNSIARYSTVFSNKCQPLSITFLMTTFRLSAGRLRVHRRIGRATFQLPQHKSLNVTKLPITTAQCWTLGPGLFITRFRRLCSIIESMSYESVTSKKSSNNWLKCGN